MAIAGTSATTTATDTSAAAAMKKSIGLNKDDFLKLFISELKYQDPLKPQDPTAMLDQLSQLSLVEQSYNSNTALANLLTAQNNSATMSSVSFIGKNVKANGNAVNFDGVTPASLQFNMPVSVDSATVAITNAAGNNVAVATLGSLAPGDSVFSWNGKDATGQPLPAGAYTFTVNGKSGALDIYGTTYTTGRIDGVNMQNGAPYLAIGSISIPLTDVLSVKGV